MTRPSTVLLGPRTGADISPGPRVLAAIRAPHPRFPDQVADFTIVQLRDPDGEIVCWTCEHLALITMRHSAEPHRGLLDWCAACWLREFRRPERPHGVNNDEHPSPRAAYGRGVAAPGASPGSLQPPWGLGGRRRE